MVPQLLCIHSSLSLLQLGNRSSFFWNVLYHLLFEKTGRNCLLWSQDWQHREDAFCHTMSIIKPSKTYYLRVIKQSKTAYMKIACRQKLREQIPCLRLKQKAPRVRSLCWHCPTEEWGMNQSQLKRQPSPQLSQHMIHCTCFSSQHRSLRMLFSPFP